MRKARIFLAIGICMAVIAVAFFAFALNHPEMSFNCSGTVTYIIYTVYFIVMIIMFPMSIIYKRKYVTGARVLSDFISVRMLQLQEYKTEQRIAGRCGALHLPYESNFRRFFDGKDKKQIISALLALTLALSLAGCGSNSDNGNSASQSADLSSAGGNGSSLGTDFQKNMTQSPGSFNYSCESESGYYFSGYNDYVYYIDREAKSTAILCGKPECGHNDENCNAYAGSALTYYGGKLYYVRDSGSSGTQLCSMKPDGTEHTVVQSLNISSDGDSYIGYTVPIIHRGMVYFLYSAVLYTVPLGADVGEAKAIYGETTQAKTVGGTVIGGIEPEFTLWADGDTFYFMTNVKQPDGTYKDTLFSYDAQNGEVAQVWEVPDKSEVGEWDTAGVEVSGWYVADGYIYFYLSGGDLWRSELSSQKTEKIADVSSYAPHGYAYYSDEYIVIAATSTADYDFDTWNVLLVYDFDGNLLNEISLESLGSTYSEEKLFVSDGRLYFIWNGNPTSGVQGDMGITGATSYALYAIDLISGELSNLHYTDEYLKAIGTAAAE